MVQIKNTHGYLASTKAPGGFNEQQGSVWAPLVFFLKCINLKCSFKSFPMSGEQTEHLVAVTLASESMEHTVTALFPASCPKSSQGDSNVSPCQEMLSKPTLTVVLAASVLI